jgi:hypothetical protein
MFIKGIKNETLVLNTINPNELDVDGLKELIANSAISIPAEEQRLLFAGLFALTIIFC